MSFWRKSLFLFKWTSGTSLKDCSDWTTVVVNLSWYLDSGYWFKQAKVRLCHCYCFNFFAEI